LVEILFFGKTFICSWQKNYWQNFYLFMGKLLYLLGQIFISWQNLNLFFTKHLSLGKTYISFWLHFYFFAKFIFPSTILFPFSCYKIFFSHFFQNHDFNFFIFLLIIKKIKNIIIFFLSLTMDISCATLGID
jgi:hypothetical protein